jgi:hypothetical protein
MIKRNLTFSGLLLFVFSITLNAQVKTSYSRMDGRMGGNIDVIGNFNRVGTKVEGNYSYNLNVDDSLLHLARIVLLYGSIDGHNKVVLKQWQKTDSTLTGLFADHRFTGSWFLSLCYSSQTGKEQ